MWQRYIMNRFTSPGEYHQQDWKSSPMDGKWSRGKTPRAKPHAIWWVFAQPNGLSEVFIGH